MNSFPPFLKSKTVEVVRNKNPQDEYNELVHYEQKEIEQNLEHSRKIYLRLQKYKNTEIYDSLLNFAKGLIRVRIFHIYSRLEKSFKNSYFLHDSSFSFLNVFIGTTVPIISKKTKYFSLFLIPEENMSNIYVHCNLICGNSIKKEYSVKDFIELKSILSNQLFPATKLKKRHSISEI